MIPEQLAESDFPAVLQQVLDKAQGNLTTEQLSRLANLLKQYQDVFAENDYDLGKLHGVRTQHRHWHGKAS